MLDYVQSIMHTNRGRTLFRIPDPNPRKCFASACLTVYRAYLYTTSENPKHNRDGLMQRGLEETRPYQLIQIRIVRFSNFDLHSVFNSSFDGS